MQKLCSFILIILFSSCTSNPESIENVLRQAGKNRKELEKVLKHYVKNPSDSLKLRAAEFLIVNMPGHWSYNAKELEAYYTEVDTVLRSNIVWHEKMRKMDSIVTTFPELSYHTVEDIHVIKSDFLIRSIDHAFTVWTTKPWARHVTFDDFCEYLLPYKVVDGQPLDCWRESLCGWLDKGLDLYYYNQHFRNSSWRATRIFVERMHRDIRPILSHRPYGIPLLSADNIRHLPAGTCQDYGHLVLAVLRSNGIPVGMDFVQQWPCQDGRGHSWNVLLTDLRKEMIFEELSGVGQGGLIRPDTKLAKVYRTTYAINRELQQLHQQEEYIPNFFSSVFIKDVTDHYVTTSDITVKALSSNNRGRNNYAYLATFSVDEWVPTALGKRDGKRFEFKQTGNDIVYLPCFYGAKGVSAFNYPFLLEFSGRHRYFIPDTTNKRDIVLYRKYPVFTNPYNAILRTLGAQVQAANREDFKDAVTIDSIATWQSAGKIFPTTERAWRYWRYVSPTKGHCNIAELMFYAPGESIPMKGHIIGTKEIWQNDSIYSREKAFDDDPLTYFSSAMPDKTWIGMDFGEPVTIETIIWLPRSDDNHIRIGDEYELFYWAEDGWRSLGKQTATDIELTFKSVPENALLWLRDHTRGMQERIFTYENNEQVWW